MASTTSLVEEVNLDALELAGRLGSETTLAMVFVCYLRRLSRFGYFSLGPITIDVQMLEDLVERTATPGTSQVMADDTVRFSHVLMQEVRRSGRKQIDELHALLAFMRCGEGLPARVFGELNITAEQLEAYLKSQGSGAPELVERLMTPEEVAEYLRVHVQTVRGWIRAGTLPARRVAGLRALRVRFGDVEKLLQPVDGAE